MVAEGSYYWIITLAHDTLALTKWFTSIQQTNKQPAHKHTHNLTMYAYQVLISSGVYWIFGIGFPLWNKNRRKNEIKCIIEYVFLAKQSEVLLSLTVCMSWQSQQTVHAVFDKWDLWNQDDQHPIPNHTLTHFALYPNRKFSVETSKCHQNLSYDWNGIDWSFEYSLILFLLFFLITKSYEPNDEQAESGVGGGNSSLTCADA